MEKWYQARCWAWQDLPLGAEEGRVQLQDHSQFTQIIYSKKQLIANTFCLQATLISVPKALHNFLWLFGYNKLFFHLFLISISKFDDFQLQLCLLTWFLKQDLDFLQSSSSSWWTKHQDVLTRLSFEFCHFKAQKVKEFVQVVFGETDKFLTST